MRNTGLSAASASWNTIAMCSPRNGSSSLLGPAEQVLAPELDLAGDLCVLREQTEDRHRRDRLARARLPHDAERLAREDVEADVVDRVHDAVVGREVDREVAHRQDGLVAVSVHSCDCGSKASRRPSPRKFTASTVSTRNSPGKKTR